MLIIDKHDTRAICSPARTNVGELKQREFGCVIVGVIDDLDEALGCLP
jgi:hypothetical protein